MAKYLYKYTTLESLALILQSKKIRLNPLTSMDDLQEAQSSDHIAYGKYVFTSSWMDQASESIAMWKLYSNMYSGVRIALWERPFKKYYITQQDADRLLSGHTSLPESDSVEVIVPPDECFNDNYFILNPWYEKTLESVEYTDDESLLVPQVFTINGQGLMLASSNLGKYKNRYWEFQNEKRHVLRFAPFDAKKITEDINVAQMVYDSFIKTSTFLPYYDLEIRDDAFQSMEITLSPQFTAGNKILLDSLCEKYNQTICIHESVLKNRVRL